MTQQSTAPAVEERPPYGHAIEPCRVMLLNEREQEAVVDTIVGVSSAMLDLADRVATGETYLNPTDEYVRKTLAKRRLEAEIRKLTTRLADLEADLVEEWAQAGRNKDGHDATGATLYLDPTAWIKYRGEPQDDNERAALKAQAGAIMQEDPDLADLVKPDYNSGTVSAYFREQYKTLLDAEREKPEHERQVIDPDSVIPEALRAVLRLDAKPRIKVRA